MERDRDKMEPRDRDRVEDYREREGSVPTERGMDTGRQGSMTAWSGSRDPWLASHFDFMRHFMREMSRMFEGFPGAGGSNYSLTSWPPIEVHEKDNQYVIRAELPGMRREDVKVRVEEDSIVIEGERKTDGESRHEGRHHESEWSYGRFSRRVMLPAQVDPDHVHARYDNGVLEVVLDMPPRARREIPVTGAESRTEGGLRGAYEARNREHPGSVRP